MTTVVATLSNSNNVNCDNSNQEQKTNDDKETAMATENTKLLLSSQMNEHEIEHCKQQIQKFCAKYQNMNDNANTLQISNHERIMTFQHPDKNKHPLLLREDYVSLETLNPHHTCTTRKSCDKIATINLIATVCGGGVLTLPLTFQRVGIIPVTIFMIFGAIITEFALYTLVICARRTGGRTYGCIAEASYGKIAKVITTATVILLLFGMIIAYLVLIRDLWSSVIFAIPNVTTILSGQWLFDNMNNDIDEYDHEETIRKRAANVLLFFILLLDFPILLKEDLHALRHTSYVGFSSCILLAIAITYRAIQSLLLISNNNFDDNDNIDNFYNNTLNNDSNNINTNDYNTNNNNTVEPLLLYSTNVKDYIFAFPIIVLCYFCSYNVLSIHTQLINPTRKRIRQILERSMFICLIIFYIIGIGGYIYARNATKDNIFLNFPIQDQAILIGRIGYCLTLFFCLPLSILPCRDAIISFPEYISEYKRDSKLIQRFIQISQRRKQFGAHLIINGVDFDNDTPFVTTADVNRSSRHGAALVLKYGTITAKNNNNDNNNTNNESPSSKEGETEKDDYDSLSDDDNDENNVNNDNNDEEIGVDDDDDDDGEVQFTANKHLRLQTERPLIINHHGCTAHVGSTIGIISITYIVAIIVPGVAAVWSICASSIIMIIGFIVPFACYLKIREHKGLRLQSFFSFIFLLFFILCAIVCTRQALIG